MLRYAPLYLKVRELLNSGRFGYIVAIDASESIRPEHGGLIMAGWAAGTGSRIGAAPAGKMLS